MDMTSVLRVATKRRSCLICRNYILENESYYHYKGRYEEEWNEWSGHLICCSLLRDDQYEVEALNWYDIVGYFCLSGSKLEEFVERFPPSNSRQVEMLKNRRDYFTFRRGEIVIFDKNNRIASSKPLVYIEQSECHN